MQCKIICSIILPLLFFTTSFAQRVGINDNGASPNSHAILDIDISTNDKGVLIPRLTSGQRVGIAGLANSEEGLTVYDETTKSFWTWDGSAWIELGNMNRIWSIAGNGGNTEGTEFIGTTDNVALDFRTNNILRTRITTKGQIEIYGTGKSLFLGEGAGEQDNLNGNENVFIGYQTGHSNTIGYSNTAVGVEALYTNDIKDNNTAIGFQTLYNNLGNENTAIGSIALYSNTTGEGNIAMGYSALNKNISGEDNVAVGTSSMRDNETGGDNAAFGNNSLYNNTSGNDNTALGRSSLFYNTTGNSNTAVGYRALLENETGDNNTAVGNQALKAITSGNSNTAIGAKALWLSNNRSNLVAVGDSALYRNGLSVTQSYHATGNTALGSKALFSNTSGFYNTATGFEALYANTTGKYNNANGYYALSSNTIGYDNTANGNQVLFSNTSGNNNTASGRSAMYNNTTGSNNTASGRYSMFDNTTGFENAAFGRSAMEANTTGYRNTAIGYSAFSTGTTYSNSTALGYNAEPGASNTVRIGNSVVSTIGGYANWTNVSDQRFKTNVQENVVGLDFIRELRPITYHLDMDAIARFQNTPDSLRLLESETLKASELQSGFIAQEVEQAAIAVGYDFHGVDKPKSEDAHYGLRYAEFVVPLVKAVQEQQETIEFQQQTIESLLIQVENIQNQLNALVEKQTVPPVAKPSG